jgi:electron transfer flavoprotein beta subunit
MHVVVLFKDVPNPAGTPPEIGPDFRLRRQEPGGGLDPADEAGLAFARRLVERDGGSIVAVSMGPEGAVRACRRALAYGADRTVLVEDDALRGSDALVTARVLAQAIRALDFDLVIAGVESADGATGAVPCALAELLDLPAVTFARQVEVSGTRLRAERQTTFGYDVLECSLPALVTLTAAAATARQPSVRDGLDARKKPLDRRSLAELGLGPDDVRPTHRVEAVEIAPERQAGEVVDEAAGPERIVRLLDELEVLTS